MNYKIVIDAGHGGIDPGAVANGLQEKDFTLEAALYIYNRLNELGVPVKITRTTDETLDRKERINRIMNAFGNRSDVILISNHINAGGGDGAEVVYALRNDDELATDILNEIAKQGQNIRGAYQRRLPENPSKDYYFIIRDTGNLQSLLLEYGFIDSPKDDVYQLQNNLEDYAEAVVKALTNYINVPYTPPQTSDQYIVKKGDSLYSIANKYNISVEELKNQNNLTSNILQIGQKLTIPKTSQSNYTVYTVQKGDSLWSIANKYGISVNDIVQENNLGTTMLTVGQQILIPAVKEEQKDQTTNKNVYIVQSGDSLWSIAKKFNISVNELKNINNLSTNMLSIGQKLTIPEQDNYEKYAVQSGDSLWKISRQYNVSVEDIIKLNNLTNNTLKVGQILLIPKK